MKSLYVIALAFVSCTNHSDMILANHDYAHCDWLLANVNHAEHTLRIIDDENVLKANRGGSGCYHMANVQERHPMVS